MHFTKTDHPAGHTRILFRLPECLLHLLNFLDSQSQARLRRVSHLGAGGDNADQPLAHAIKVALLRTAVLELLTTTKLPMLPESFSVGLSGLHYNVNTAVVPMITEVGTFGISETLVRTICKLFQLEKPGVAFTTIRIQKFAASANFDGKQRTLPISKRSFRVSVGRVGGSPDQPEESAVDEAERAECDEDVPAFVLCLTSGCQGGYAEFCNCVAADEVRFQKPILYEVGHQWQHFVTPISERVSVCWSKFSEDTWLRWYWPRAGDYYTITISCEPRKHIRGLQSSQRRLMRWVGFRFPPPWEPTDEEKDGEDDSADCNPEGGPNPWAATDEPDLTWRPRTRDTRKCCELDISLIVQMSFGWLCQ